MHHAPAPTSKERNAWQREVTRLLDALAPERTNPRATRPAATIQQHRSPNGCILQADAAALTVTWYAEATNQDRIGELQIVLWRGVVSQRGARPVRTPAEMLRQEVLTPVERPTDDSVWVAADGSLLNTAELAERCLSLLHQEMQAVA